MNTISRTIGALASLVWLLLTILTALSGLLMSGALEIHLIVACLFLAIAGLAWWRVRAVADLCTAVDEGPALRRLLIVEAVSSSVLLVAGMIFLSGAAYRIFGEGMAVFG